MHAKRDNATHIIGLNAAKACRYSCKKNICLQDTFILIQKSCSSCKENKSEYVNTNRLDFSD